jgi:hypothetical protein
MSQDTEDEDESDQWRRAVNQNSGAQPDVHDLQIQFVCFAHNLMFCTYSPVEI